MSTARTRAAQILRCHPDLSQTELGFVLSAEGLSLSSLDFGAARSMARDASDDTGTWVPPSLLAEAREHGEWLEEILELSLLADETFGIDMHEEDVEQFACDPFAYLAARIDTKGAPLTEAEIRARLEQTRAARPLPWTTDAEVDEALQVFGSARVASRRDAWIAEARPETDDPLASWLGTVRVAMPGEEWPIHDGRPLRGVLQLRVAELGSPCPLLDGIELLTVFCDADEQPDLAYRVRAYPSVEGLVHLPSPRADRFRAVRWRATVDEPPLAWCIEDRLPAAMFGRFQASISTFLSDAGLARFDAGLVHATTTKVGGWPSIVQNGPSWETWRSDRASAYETVLQFGGDREVGLEWGDSGVCWIGRARDRSATDPWVLGWEGC